MLTVVMPYQSVDSVLSYYRRVYPKGYFTAAVKRPTTSF